MHCESFFWKLSKFRTLLFGAFVVQVLFIFDLKPVSANNIDLQGSQHRIVFYNQGENGYYGNNVTQRTSDLSSSSMKSWIDFEVILPRGILRKFYLLTNSYSSLNESSTRIRLQIWRPVDPAALTFTLVWQQLIQVQSTSTVPMLYTYSTNEMIILENGDRIGWTNEGTAGPISFQYEEKHRTFFMNLEDSQGHPQFPKIHRSYKFNQTCLPGLFSIAVLVDQNSFQIGAQKATEPVRASQYNFPVGDTGATGPTGQSGQPGSRGPRGSPGPAGQKGPSSYPGGTGPIGATGAPGKIGAPGYPGSKGAIGATGIVGATGFTGPGGSQGTSGTGGISEYTGPSGPFIGIGATGSIGSPGAAGAIGPAGDQGPMGAPGPPGDCLQVGTGSTVEPGSPGPAGVPGYPGPIGAIGPIGQTGDTGVAGPPGATGATGPSGVEDASAGGPPGATGYYGSTGATGYNGQIGVKGPIGSPGPQGQPGPQGYPGPPGQSGPPGQPGPPGACSGPIGPPGNPGSTGATGYTGPQGFRGATGPPGARGALGQHGNIIVTGLPESNYSIEPSYGPVAGGTNVTIIGGYLSENVTVSTVYIGTNLQGIITNRSSFGVLITTPPIDVSYINQQMLITLDISFNSRSSMNISTEKYFIYKPNPYISDVSPKNIILSGGIQLMVSGNNLSSVAHPQTRALVLVRKENSSEIYDESFTPCNPATDNGTRMLCLSPPINFPKDVLNTSLYGSQESPYVNVSSNTSYKGTDGYTVSVNIGIRLDGYKRYIDNILEDNPGQHFQIFSYPSLICERDMEFDTSKDDVIAIKGKDMTRGCQKEDYTVHLGKDICQIRDLTENQLTCTPPRTKPQIDASQNFNCGDDMAINVNIGYKTYKCSCLKYAVQKINILVIVLPTVLGGTFLVLIVVLMIMCVLRRRKGKKPISSQADVRRQERDITEFRSMSQENATAQQGFSEQFNTISVNDNNYDTEIHANSRLEDDYNYL